MTYKFFEKYAMTTPIVDCEEAMMHFEVWSSAIKKVGKDKFLSSTIFEDDGEWWILSGSDLTFDRSGSGTTIPNAVDDFIRPYIILN